MSSRKNCLSLFTIMQYKIGQLDATGAGPVMQQKRLILQKQLINNGMGW